MIKSRPASRLFYAFSKEVLQSAHNQMNCHKKAASKGRLFCYAE
ncbi:hypothetical protein HMPREF0201_03564 [Cedecea davisae DSM 4568]|uniref:Uncharacterized protein n=1 Tax=Cedecea davisae DSM 4568 TaxID=566551 RepID=S3J5Q3_9ENTR|nr:hypothetical protein HMPREF0201_03564 [Cedecea davisae DSM 4568]